MLRLIPRVYVCCMSVEVDVFWTHMFFFWSCSLPTSWGDDASIEGMHELLVLVVEGRVGPTIWPHHCRERLHRPDLTLYKLDCDMENTTQIQRFLKHWNPYLDGNGEATAYQSRLQDLKFTTTTTTWTMTCKISCVAHPHKKFDCRTCLPEGNPGKQQQLV